MNNKTMLLIYNPHSGKAQFKQKLADIIELFTKNGYTVTVHPTQCEKDATDIVQKNSTKYDLIVCSGGDGTLSEAMNGLMQSNQRPLFGYIPSGTVNDFATSLNIPKDISSAAQTIINGKPFNCDVGTFNSQTFSYIVAFGLFTDVSYKTPQEHKNILVRMAYILEGAKRLPNIPSYSLTVKMNDQTITDEFIFGMVTNSISVGGFRGLTGQNVQMDDGLFEIVLAKKPKNAVDFHGLLQCIINATIDSKYLCYGRASYIEIQSNDALDWSVDGEFGGKTSNAIIENHKQAITIMVNNDTQPHI